MKHFFVLTLLLSIISFGIASIAKDNQKKSQHQKDAPTAVVKSSEGFRIDSHFSPSGYMGDQVDLKVKLNSHVKSKIGKSCIELSYTPRKGTDEWAGLYWLNRPDNWGDFKGEDLSQKGFKKITFWARGKTGMEMIKVTSGGIDGSGKPYKDSFLASAGRIELSKNWQQYSIDLSGKDLSSVIGGFAITFAKASTNGSSVVFLDGMQFE